MITPGVIVEYVAKQLLQAFLRALQTFAVWIDIPDGDRDGWVLGPSSATCLNLRPTAKDSPCLVCCPLQVDEALGRAWIELNDVEALDPQLRGDLDDPGPVRILRGSAVHGSQP
jgi:hypothetical protein